MKLNYQTRGENITPQGKPKIYFCCHPQDFERCFESICREILKVSNCAVFFDEKPFEEGNLVEWESILSGMQLFVMPVTSRLLEEPNKGLDDYRIAIKYNIPVLPLMQESGLDSQFNQICGNLQYLDKFKKDDTAISYEHKFKKFLNDVIVGDETAQKIRDAFRSYIFLSYRKKDRAHAQRLMKLIHKYDYCRDVAIWYDEFLVPGEDFNNAIGDALAKSDLFLLAVTPNLVCEPNYVQAVEYPMAVDSGKNILPVEMCQTDRNLLQEQYPNIPLVVPEDDENLLDEQLKVYFDNSEYAKNDDLTHNYLISLAYLDGVDVEVDYAKSVEMLTKGANKQHTLSIEKLVQMYNVGKGVKRNTNTAIYWQSLLVEIYKTNVNLQNTSSCYNYAYSLWELGDLYVEINAYDKALDIFTAMKDFSAKWAEVNENPSALKMLARSYRKLGNLHFQLFNSQQAKDNYYFAEHILLTLLDKKQYADSDEQYDILQALSDCYGKLSDIFLKEEDFDYALDFAQKNVDVVNEIVALGNKNDKDNDWLLFNSYCTLMDIFLATDNEEQASKYCQPLLTLAQKMYDEDDDEVSKGNLSHAYNLVAQICQRQGDDEGAKKCFELSLKYNIEIYQENPTLDNLHTVSISHSYLALNCIDLGLFEQAENHYLQCVATAEEIHSKAKTTESQFVLCEAYCSLGRFYLDQDNRLARKFLDKAYALSSKLVEQTDDYRIKQRHAYVVLYLGEYLFFCEDLQEKGFDLLFHSMEILQELAQDNDSDQIQDGIVRVYRDIAIAYHNTGKHQLSLEYHTKCLQIEEMYADKYNTILSWQNVVECCLDVAEVYQYLGDWQKSLEYYSKADIICDQLLNRTNAIKIYYMQSNVCGEIAQMFFENKVYDLALQYYQKKLDVDLIISASDVEFAIDEKILYDHIDVASCFEQKEEYKNAIEHLKMAEVLFLQMMQNDDFDLSMNILAHIYAKLGLFTEYEGDVLVGISYYKKQLNVVEQEISVGKDMPASAIALQDKIAWTYEAIEDYDNAEKWFTIRYNNAKSLYEKDKALVVNIEYLATACKELARYYLRRDDVDNAIDWFVDAYNYLCDACQARREALSEEDLVVKEDGTDYAQYYHADLEEMGFVLLQLATLYGKVEDYDSMDTCYVTAYGCYDELCQQVGESDHYYRLSRAYYGMYVCGYDDSLQPAKEIAQMLSQNNPNEESYADWWEFLQTVVE